MDSPSSVLIKTLVHTTGMGRVFPSRALGFSKESSHPLRDHAASSFITMQDEPLGRGPTPTIPRSSRGDSPPQVFPAFKHPQYRSRHDVGGPVRCGTIPVPGAQAFPPGGLSPAEARQILVIRTVHSGADGKKPTDRHCLPRGPARASRPRNQMMDATIHRRPRLGGLHGSWSSFRAAYVSWQICSRCQERIRYWVNFPPILNSTNFFMSS